MVNLGNLTYQTCSADFIERIKKNLVSEVVVGVLRLPTDLIRLLFLLLDNSGLSTKCFWDPNVFFLLF
jgi:hypothetical protein